MPHVSVLINTYNHEKFIEQSIQSVCEQTFPASEMEIIVVDDGSNDRTPEIIRKFVPRIRYIRKENGGQVSAFNAAIAEARGEIVAFLDGDDYWAPEKIAEVVKAFERNPSAAAVGHAYYEVDAQGLTAATVIPGMNHLSLENPRVARESYPLCVFLGTSRFAIRRSVLERFLPVPPELPFFDNFLFSQALGISEAILLSQPLCYYRVHANNLWESRAPDERILWIKHRLLSGLLKHLPSRLAALGVPLETIDAYLEGTRPEADRLRLKLEGGKRREAFRVERACFQLAYQNPDFGYRMFNKLVLFLTLLLPPRAFYRMRDWYAQNQLSRARKMLGDAQPSESKTFIRREQAAAPAAKTK